MGMLPAVHYGDIYNYLIYTPGLYTAESLKAYKSLDGYNFFISGHVHEVLFHEVNAHVCFLKTTVIPSQKISDKKQWHKVWICLDRDKGYVISAHCTCKAGTGEACSHVAALLFKVETAVKLELTNPSKTSAACVWNQYYREKVAAEPLSEINFSQPKHGKVHKRKPRPAPDTDSDDDFDVEAALRALKRICPNACVLTKDDSDTDTASDEEMPPFLIRKHSISGQLSEEALAAECRAFLQDFTVTPTQASNLEKMARNKSESGLWKRQRLGRITASVAHDVKTRKEETKSDALIKKIMDSVKTDISGLPSVRFGLLHEKKAKKQYNDIMVKEHVNFVLRDSGLVVDTTFPMYAASPDGVRTCECHGEGLVEVKCAYKHRDVFVHDIPGIDPTFYLTKESLTLKEGHRHYTQIQFQMYVCQKQFCDFVVYTNKGVFIQTIHYDDTFVRHLVDRCTAFAMSELVPAVIMKNNGTW